MQYRAEPDQRNHKRQQPTQKRLLTVKRTEKPKIGILGLAFKNGTDDCRESPAIDIVFELLERKTQISVYDPKAMENARNLLGNKINYADDMYSVADGADVLAVLTEWEEFKELDLSKLSTIMNNKIIVDCRNLLNPREALKFGFNYQGIGTTFFRTQNVSD